MNTFEISLVVSLAVVLAFLAGALLVYFNYAKIVKQVQRTVAELAPVVKTVETVVADVKKL